MDGENRRTVLMADDDAEDCMLAAEALAESGAEVAFKCIGDGMELMNHLSCCPNPEALPNLILLDLNMPRKDGRQALVEIKSEPRLQHIPIVILTTSSEERDIAFSMREGADSFVTKPITFDEWVGIMKSLVESWIGK